jgi:hypothetical protein
MVRGAEGAGGSCAPCMLRVSGMSLGNGKNEETCFKNRFQPVRIRLGAATTSGTCLSPAGNPDLLNLNFASAGKPAAVTHAHTYVDPLNRLATSAEQSNWSRTFVYEGFGNLWMGASSGGQVDTFTHPDDTWYGVQNRLHNTILGIHSRRGGKPGCDRGIGAGL